MTKSLTLAVLIGTTVLAHGGMISAAVAQTAPAPLVLAEDDQLDLQTRDDLRTTLLGTGGKIRDIANRMVTTRNALIQCLNGISDAEGRITDMQQEKRCYVDEIVSSRTNLVAVGDLMINTEEKLRGAEDRYIGHANEVGEMKAANRQETAELSDKLSETLAQGAKIHAHKAAGHEMTADMRKAALKAAYLVQRLESRLETNARITSSLKTEEALFHAVARNLGEAADGLVGHSLSFFTQAEVLKEQLEEITINQRLQTADFLTSAARSDWSGLQDTLGDLNDAMVQLQADRSKFTIDVPDTSEADAPWSAPENDSVLNAFMARFDEPDLTEATQ